MKYSFSYLLNIQFLGFRFHGWQKQIDVKTLHDIVDKSLSFVFSHKNYKSLGVGRTDAKVSANSYFVQLFTNELIEENSFTLSLNQNFPNDFKILSIQKTPLNFNLINTPKTKEYHYYFSYGEKNHPFAAPFMVGINENLNIKLMKKGAKLFEGIHHFNKYCTKPSKNTIFKRTIDACEITENTLLTASFFPKQSFILTVKGKGFLRYQIRLIMGTLFELGRNNITLDFIKNSLTENNDQTPLRHIAPASGLQLYNVTIPI